MDEAFVNPDKYIDLRNNVLLNRFDYTDDGSAERCFQQIMNFKKLNDEYIPYQSDAKTVPPTVAEQIAKYVDSSKYYLIDSRKNMTIKKSFWMKLTAQKKYIILLQKYPGIQKRECEKFIPDC